MSNRRSIAWLLFLVALAVAAHLFLTWRGDKMAVEVRQTVLVPKADGADLIEMRRPNAPATVLVRAEDWKIQSPLAAAVETPAVLRLVDALAFTPVADVLTAPEMHRLGRSLEDFGLIAPRLTIAVRKDGAESSVSFGSATPAGDGIYAAVGTEKIVCVVPTNVFAAIDLPLDALRRQALLSESLQKPVAIDIRRPLEKSVRVSLADGTWQMTAPQKIPASSARITALLEVLKSARLARIVWPTAADAASTTPTAAVLSGYGLDAESAVTITLKGAGGELSSVSFGKGADKDFSYVLAQDGRVVGVVDAKVADQVRTEMESLGDLRLFPYEAAAVQMLSVTDGDTVYLVARQPDGAWRLDSPVSAPADAEAVRALVAGLLSLRSTERDAHGLLVSVSTNDAPVAVSRDALLVQNRLENLRSKTMLKIPAERIRRLTVTTDEGRVQAVIWDAEKRTWLVSKPENALLDGLSLAGVLATLDPLTAAAVVQLRVAASEAGNYGLEKPRFTIAIDPQDEGAVRRNVLIGSAAPGGGCYATVGASDAVFVLSDKTVQALTASFVTAQ